jgi:hypothetical protein
MRTNAMDTIYGQCLPETTGNTWIGWSPAQPQQRFALVAQNSRFLILPGVPRPNLAGRLLALCVQRLDSG